MESTVNQPILPNLAASLWQAIRRVAGWFGLAADDQVLPRKSCHFTTLPLKGVPRKHLEAAVRLRLQQLGVFEQVGFAYQLVNDQAQVWYWDDTKARLLFPTGRVLPWPEPLWRTTPTQGVRLVACTEGYELEGANAQGVYRSRWFAQRPDPAEQQAFCRDLGLEADTSSSAIASGVRLDRPATGWRISTALARPIPGWVWITLLMAICAGSLTAVEFAQLGRISQQIQTEEQASKALRQQSATAISLEATLSELRPTLSAIQTYSDAQRQTHWLAELAKRNIIGNTADVYLNEWVFAGGRVTATFRLGTKARSADLLASLEKSGLFSDISLIPDPPTGTLRILLRLPGGSGETPAAVSKP